MNVFVAGGTGTIGIPVVRALVAGGHQVTALTRSASEQDAVRALGANAAVADAFNREALIAALEAAHPTHVIHQLTALPKDGPRRARDLDATNRLRVDGTRNLLNAAIDARVNRRRDPSLRHVLWSRVAVYRQNDPNGAQTPAAGLAASADRALSGALHRLSDAAFERKSQG